MAETLHWEKPEVTGTPPAPRAYHASAVLRNELFIFGGWNGQQRLHDLHILNTGTVPLVCISSWAVVGLWCVYPGLLYACASCCTDTMSWSKVKAQGFAPCPRVGMTMVPFPAHNALIMYGGLGDNSGFQDLCVSLGHWSFHVLPYVLCWYFQQVFDTEQHIWKGYTLVGESNSGVYQPVLEELDPSWDLAAAVFSADTGVLSPHDDGEASGKPKVFQGLQEDSKSVDTSSPTSPGEPRTSDGFESSRSEHNPQSVPMQLNTEGAEAGNGTEGSEAADSTMPGHANTERTVITPRASTAKFTLSRVYGSPTSLLSTPPLVTVIGEPRAEPDSGGRVTRGLHFPDGADDGFESPMHRLMQVDGDGNDAAEGQQGGGGVEAAVGSISRAEGLQGSAGGGGGGGGGAADGAVSSTAVSSPPAGSGRTQSTPIKTPIGSTPPVYHNPSGVYVRGPLVSARSGHSMCSDGQGRVFIVGGAIGRRYAGYVLEMDAAPWRRTVIPPHLFDTTPPPTAKNGKSEGHCGGGGSSGSVLPGGVEGKSHDDIDMEGGPLLRKEEGDEDMEEWEAVCSNAPSPVTRFPLLTQDTAFHDLTLVRPARHAVVLGYGTNGVHCYCRLLGSTGFMCTRWC